MARVSLKDVAREAGTSISAVSKAVHGSPEIGSETTKKILDAAQRLGYYPNNSARSIRLGKSYRLGVILPSFSGVYSDILSGIESFAAPAGYAVIVLNTQNVCEAEQKCILTLLSMPVDAILSVPVSLENYKNINVPLIFLSRFPFRPPALLKEEYNQYNYVIVNDFDGQRIATEHLIHCCGTNVYIALGCPDDSNVWGSKDQIRLAGYSQALEDAGLPFNPSHVLWGATKEDSGYSVVKQICQSAEFPLGLCINDDITAIGAVHAIADSGLRIPEDVCLVGYDNLSFSEHMVPPLTTVHSQKFSAGKYAAEQIIESLNTGNDIECKKLFEPFLCIRSTTCITE